MTDEDPEMQRNDSVTDATPQPDNVHHLPDPIRYDTEALAAFLDAVFAADDLADDEHILGWAVRGRPGYPRDVDVMIDTRLARSTQPMALYYGTATARPAEDDKRLYNRKALCVRTFVVVLDDIGTKVAIADLPEPLRTPSYVIESSPGNFQYGYILDTPIADLDAASALVRLLYGAGVSDGGGALANKLVRLPGGVNGKPGENEQFPVRLVELHPANRWSPDDLLRAAGVQTTWTDVLRDGPKVFKATDRKKVTAWSSVVATSPNLDGLLDPVLEWMYERDLVSQEVGDWATVRCPWAHEHTTGDEGAGYSPLGRGSPPHDVHRGFHCFHEHCRDRTARDFLTWVAASGGPELPVRDDTTPLHTNWTYDPGEDRAYPVRVPGTETSEGVALNVLKRLYPSKVRIPTSEGKTLTRSVVDIWVESPHRVLTYGALPDPTTSAPISNYAGGQYINTFRAPAWAAPDPQRYQHDVEKFSDFIEYLIPREDERAFFLDWLSAKVQQQAFRGPAILMATPTQGTGRTTLGAMISTLLGGSNTTTVDYDRLVGANTFNDWLLHTLVICNEVYQGRSAPGNAFFRNFERLKTLIDFQPLTIAINRKNQHIRAYPVFTSFLMFSNHMDALPVDVNDRRFYVLSNTWDRRDKKYFTDLNAWLEDAPHPGAPPAWGASVDHWLRNRDVDVTKLYAPAAMTATKHDMIQSSRTAASVFVDELVDRWFGNYISVAALEELITDGPVDLSDRLGLEGNPRALRIQLSYALQRVAKRPLAAMQKRVRLHGNWGSKQHTVWVLNRAPRPVQEAVLTGALDTQAILADFDNNNPTDLRAWIASNM